MRKIVTVIGANCEPEKADPSRDGRVSLTGCCLYAISGGSLLDTVAGGPQGVMKGLVAVVVFMLAVLQLSRFVGKHSVLGGRGRP